MSRHLIHVGFAKAGATFFKAWCASRDDVAFVHDGIAGYATIRDLALAASSDPRPLVRVTSSETLVAGHRAAWRRRGRAKPLDPVAWHEEPAARIRQEDEACEAVQRRACTLLHELAPGAHVLVLVRGYDTLPGSMLSQGVKTGARVDGQQGEGFREEMLAYVASVAHYDRVVGLYEAAFPGRVTVLPFEMLRADREAYVAALCEVAGVAYRPFDPGRVNASPPPHALGLMRRVWEVAGAGLERLPERLQPRSEAALGRALRWMRRGRWPARLDQLGRSLRVTPVAPVTATPAQLHAVFAGRADAVAKRPYVRPYAAQYVFPPSSDAP